MYQLPHPTTTVSCAIKGHQNARATAELDRENLVIFWLLMLIIAVASFTVIAYSTCSLLPLMLAEVASSSCWIRDRHRFIEHSNK